MLACWHRAGAGAIAADISARTTLTVTTETVERGAEAAQALDTWMSNGGFLPEEWARAKGPM